LGRKGECDDLTEGQIIDAFLGKENIDILGSACDYDGVHCNEEKKVVEIVVAGLGLKGTLPDNLGYLSMLSKLDVSDNELTGYFPSGLRFAPLKSLHVSGNMLKGIIPPLMCEKSGSINGDNEECTSIACPVGKFSQDKTGFGECTPCISGAPYLGSTECLPFTNVTNPQQRTEFRSDGPMIIHFLLFFLILGLLWKIAVVLIVNKRTKEVFGCNRRKSDDGSKWLQNHLSRNYHYLISLKETEAVTDPIGVKSSDVARGEIDDYGWVERESILKHRDIENAVQTQKNSSNLQVWEYPDPLEMPKIYNNETTIHNEDFLITDDGEDDLINFIKQQNKTDTREVWLDVPQVS